MNNDSCIIQKRLVGEKDSKQITSDEYLLAQKGRNDFEEDQVDCFKISYSPLGLRLILILTLKYVFNISHLPTTETVSEIDEALDINIKRWKIQ